MKIEGKSPEEYIENIPQERQAVFAELRKTILENISADFEECMIYGMIGYVVPKSIYPDGYHCNPELPLPFINIASQKNFIALYHMGMYADKAVYDWFVAEYPKHCKYKLDMGKSCVRFKKIDDIPLKLIAALMQKMSASEWIATYEANFKK